MRKVKIAVSFILLFAALSLGAYAAESDSAYDSQLEKPELAYIVYQ